MQTRVPIIYRRVTELFEERVRSAPEKVAVRCGDRTASYEELNRLSNRTARCLERRGGGPGVLVAVCMDRSVEMVACILAVLKSRATYLPIDPAYNERARIAYVLEHARASVVLSRAHIGALTPSGCAELRVDDDRDEILSASPDNLDAGDGADAVAAVFFTSGTTANAPGRGEVHRRLKGATITHGALSHFVQAMVGPLQLSESDVYLHAASVSFVTSLRQILVPLCHGATVSVGTADDVREPMALFEKMAREGITVFDTVPSYWRQCIAVLARLSPSARRALLDNRLRLIATAGDALFADIPLAWSEFGHPARLINFWGQTETAGSASYHPYSPTDVEPGRLVPIGVPLSGTELYVLSEFLEPVADGGVGELYVASPSVTAGYFGEESDPAKFVRRSLGSASPRLLYRTGDLGRRSREGVLEYMGRADDQVKVNGIRIYPLDVEGALRAHPGIADAAVVGEQVDGRSGHLAAYIVLREDSGRSGPSAQELRDFLGATLPKYLVPASFTAVPAIPRLSNGKIDRRSLRRPESATPRTSQVVPTLEGTVLAVFRDALHNSAFGPDDDFFQHGGDSLHAIETMAALSEKLELRVPTAHLFRASTVIRLAAAIRDMPSYRDRSGLDGIVTTAPTVGSGTLDLRLEAALPPSIRPESSQSARTGSPARVLLTGATGFFGAHLLSEILRRTHAEVFCLIRASGPDAARRRIDDALGTLGLFPSESARRIVPVVGDLMRPQLGFSGDDWTRLAESVDTLVHCGAFVHYLYAYDTLKAANVGSAVETLRLACTGRAKRVLYVSTIGIFGVDSAEGTYDPTVLDDPSPLKSGYVQSKWVADRIMRIAQELLPVTIVRPGRITWSRTTGKANPNDVLTLMLTACLALRLAPDLDALVPMSPVDELSQLVVQHMRDPGCSPTVNVPHLTGIRWKDLIRSIRSLGYALPTVPYGVWLERLRSSDELMNARAQGLGGLSLWLAGDAPPSFGWVDGAQLPGDGDRSGDGAALLDDAQARDLCATYLQDQERTGFLKAV